MKKLSIKELEENEDCKISHEHLCDKNISPNEIRIYHMTETEYGKQESWVLLSMTIADEKWVYDGEAEYIGEIIDSRSYMIHYCPFCGQKLL